MPLTESRAMLLDRLRRVLAHRTEARGLPHERYDRTHEHFERSSDQQPKILEWLREFVDSNCANLDPLEILSVGCGSGILDNPLIESLAGKSKRTNYMGVDPNGIACRRFRSGFVSLELPNVQLELFEQSVECLCPSLRFDLIHAVHSLYYLSDPAGTLDFLLELLAPEGKLVVMQAPKAELNEFADCFWRQHSSNVVWFSERIEQHIVRRGLEFEKHRIVGWVNVTRCFESDCPRGEMLMDFITQTDCGSLNDSILQICLSYLRSVSKKDNDQMLVAHPVDVFVIDGQRSISAPIGDPVDKMPEEY